LSSVEQKLFSGPVMQEFQQITDSFLCVCLPSVITFDQLTNHHETLYDYDATTVCSFLFPTIANTNMAAVRISEIKAPLTSINGVP
jgi:hypothetical protein